MTKKLTKDEAINILDKFKEAGYGFDEIAVSCGLSISTLYRLRDPKGRNPGRHVSRALNEFAQKVFAQQPGSNLVQPAAAGA